MQKKLVPLCLLACIALAGCSSANKITKDLLISSEPPGASVYLDGDKIGETPLKVQTFFTWNKDEIYNSLLRRVVQVKKDGYESQVRDLYPIDMPNIQFLLNRENTKGDAK